MFKRQPFPFKPLLILLFGAFWAVPILAIGASTIYQIYLPLAMQKSSFCFEGPQEIEPNNSRAQANGPLCLWQTYEGIPDQKDFFRLYLDQPASLMISLKNYPGTGVQLLLYDAQINEIARTYIAVSPNSYLIEQPVQPGTYYIFIYSVSWPDSTTYQLRVEDKNRTPTFTPTQTSTPTITFTPTSTSTPTNSSTPTLTPTPTSTPLPGMVYVPAGNFQMGCDPAHNGGHECAGGELPIHTVYLDTYQIDIREVTNAQYAQCVASSTCAVPKVTSSVTRAS